ncbi:glycosyltransferase 61 family protein [Methylobacterium oryzae]|uniref:glycosyltransferase 61 family protein n=1 Tax=Methylobacterium oryzae TaxID=334852 RepID=UPI001F1844D6|nr:glycosyltransferase 61 family protein [Methylobacterium oryzae]UIN32957.1 glycosyltransferase 61 family protein [Methylobacterium oryzae]
MLNRFISDRLFYLSDAIISAKKSADMDHIIRDICVYGHIGWLRGRSLTRLHKDISDMQNVCGRQMVSAYGNPLRALLIPISDPIVVPWPVHHEHHLRDGIQEDFANISERISETPALLVGILFAGYLKHVGRFTEARSVYLRMTKLGHTFEGCFGLADVEHLHANWSKEMRGYRDGGFYRPGKAVSPRDFQISEVAADEKFALAIAWYEKAVAARPNNLMAQRALGRALIDAGNVEAGILQLSRITADSRLARHAAFYANAVANNAISPDEAKESFSDLECFPDRSARMRHIEIASTREAADLLCETAELKYPATVLSGTYVADSHGPEVVQTSLHFPDIWASSFANARSLKHGILIADDRFLITDGKGLPGLHRKLFSPDLYAVADDTAVVGLWPAEHAVTGEAILLIGATFNYYHWLLETLPALMMLKSSPATAEATIYLESALQPFQSDSLRLALPSDDKISVLDHDVRNYWFERVHHVQNSSILMVPRPTSVLMMRSALSRHLPAPRPGKRVYLSRRSAGSRQNQNEKALVRLLSRYSIAPVDTGRMSLTEQIEFFKDVELVVAPAGAALTNLIFCPSSTRVVIMTSGPHHFETFTAIAAAIGQRCWVSMGSGTIRTNPYFVWTSFDLKVNIPSLSRCLDAAIS